MKRSTSADEGLMLNIFHSRYHTGFPYRCLITPTFASGFPNKSCFVSLQRNFEPDIEVHFSPKF